MLAKSSLPLILTLLASGVVASAQGMQSVYTTLRVGKCKTLGERESFRSMECPGVAGYKLQVEVHDITETLTVIGTDGSKHGLGVGHVGRGGFPAIGTRAEWRVRRERGKLVPVALIVRVTVSEYAGGDAPRREVSYLTVTKITPQEICITKSILAGRNSNMKARRLADKSAGEPCYEPSGPAGP
ncbi:MAG TPA: hypothetical protein VJ715_20405 [Pyrinomonadaceae bacterium]|nr:hypothetical protein [Pyrinomonadaceae bacterium]